METLTQFLRPKQVLLVLDNCEHLLDPVVVLVRALEANVSAAGGVRHEPRRLGIAGERIVALAPLQLPGLG
jgi:predicted ATPase